MSTTTSCTPSSKDRLSAVWKGGMYARWSSVHDSAEQMELARRYERLARSKEKEPQAVRLYYINISTTNESGEAGQPSTELEQKCRELMQKTVTLNSEMCDVISFKNTLQRIYMLRLHKTSAALQLTLQRIYMLRLHKHLLHYKSMPP